MSWRPGEGGLRGVARALTSCLLPRPAPINIPSKGSNTPKFNESKQPRLKGRCRPLSLTILALFREIVDASGAQPSIFVVSQHRTQQHHLEELRSHLLCMMLDYQVTHCCAQEVQLLLVDLDSVVVHYGSCVLLCV